MGRTRYKLVYLFMMPSNGSMARELSAYDYVRGLARKATDDIIDGLTLGMLRLRAVPEAIHSSEKIAEMAKDSLAVWKASKQLQCLWRNDPRYKQVLDPKRIRAAFVDHIMLKRWQQEMRAAGRCPSGSSCGGDAQ